MLGLIPIAPTVFWGPMAFAIMGGLAFGLTYGRPEPSIESIAGAPAIKSATLSVTIDYESDLPLA